MFGRFFPKVIDNAYRGPVFAIWLLVPIVLMKFLMGLNVAGLNPWIDNRDILQNVDKLPLDAYGAQAASVMVFGFACWGLALLLLSSLGILVLVRYRALIPLMYLMLSIEQLGRKGILLLHPIARTVDSATISQGVVINWGLTAALLTGLILSLLPSKAGGVHSDT